MDYSPESFEERVDQYLAWVNTIQSHYLSENRPDQSGARLMEKDNIQTDGPFLETKEMIAGFIIIQADDLAQAIKIANTCPLLQWFEIFVRPMINLTER